MSRGSSVAHRGRQPAHELEGSANLRRRLIRIVLDDPDARDAVAACLELAFQTGTQEMLGPGAATPAPAGSIVGDK
jgi:hypothetical protein